MPIYEYRCTDCSHDFSKLQKVSADPPVCPECGHDEVAKKVSQTTFQLKGGGWYVTDFRDGGGGPGAAKKPEGEAPAESAGTETKNENKADGSSETKTETKPDAAKSDAKSDTKSVANVDAKPAQAPAAPARAESPKKAKKSPGPSGSGSA